MHRSAVEPTHDGSACADESRRESEDRFQFMADSAPVMIWVTDADRRFEWFNRCWLDFTGRAMAQELGSGWMEGVHSEDLERCSGIFNASVQARQPFTMDFRLRRRDGSHRWVLANGVPRFSPDGSFHGYTGTCIDIHERKELEERLAERTRALRLADRRKDEFLAMLAHDLRNPLGPIANATAILKVMESQLPAIGPVRQIVERQLEQLRRVIADMRDVTRITQAKIELQREPVAIDEIVRHALETAQPQIDGRGHRLQLELPAERLTVCGDAMRLGQALSHLLVNAAKFSPAPGAIELSAKADEARLQLRVKDAGQGIHPDFLPHVFEPFAQETHTKPRTNNGLGVGLTIAKRLAELHGGDIVAASDGPGTGATFTLTLPLLQHPATAPAFATEANAAATLA